MSTLPLHAHRTFAADEKSVAQARAFAREMLETWDAGDLADSVVLLVSELVTNAVVHAGTTARLELRLDPQSVRVEVEDLHPRRVLPMMVGQPTEDAEDRLEKTGLPSFRDDRRDGRPILTETVDPLREFRDEADDLSGGGPEHRAELVVGQRREHRAERTDDRLVGRVGPRPVGGATHHGHRLLQAGHATDGLVDEPARADAGGPVDQQRP